MDENQNYGYNEGNYENQGMNQTGQPYDNQQYAQGQPYGTNGQPYGQQQPVYNQTPYGAQQQYNQANFGQPVKAVVYDAVPSNHNGVAVAALICGILSIFFCWVPLVDLGVSIAAVVCGIITLTKKYDGKGMAIAGLITGVIGLLLSLYFMFCYAIVGALFM